MPTQWTKKHRDVEAFNGQFSTNWLAPDHRLQCIMKQEAFSSMYTHVCVSPTPSMLILARDCPKHLAQPYIGAT